MLVDPGRSPYDVNFRLFGHHIRVHPLFWLGAGLLGGNLIKLGLPFWLIWIAVVFVSVLVHELGHALTYRWFRRQSSIVLYVFGGLTIPEYSLSGRWRRIVVSLAGPLAGFLIPATIYFSNRVTSWEESIDNAYLGFAVGMLFIVNIYWGVFNLLPIYPLDGGMIVRELCQGISRRRGLIISLQISIWSALMLSLYCFICYYEIENQKRVLLAYLPWWLPQGSLLTGIFFMVFAYQNYQMFQQARQGYYNDNDRLPWEK